MAEFGPAVEKTLRAEGGFAQIPSTGEVVNRGIGHWLLRDIGLSKTYPTKTPRSVPASDGEIEQVRDMSLDDAKNLYIIYFWNKNRCGEITDQPLAEKFFDLSVNMGPGQAAKLLQRAVNVFAWPEVHVAEDGAVGPKTIAAVNTIGSRAIVDENAGQPMTLLDYLKGEASTFYRNLAASKPVLASNLAGWLKRVDS